MRRREDMQVNVAGLRRNIKNLAHNYSDAQIKVREATSNDPWGPSSTLMSEIADLTYNVVAFTEIMQMIWKRLNDHGRNWRHVYKALLLLEYLIKTGSEKVGQQCKENIFAIQTLRDFQYSDEGKDQGHNVREKAKQLVSLLKDEERLRNERARALKAKERFAQTASGFGSDTTLDGASPSSPTFQTRSAWSSSDVETPSKVDIMCARPTTAGEEELQLQLALAMSREEAEQEEQKRRSDDVRLQLAISQSQNEFKQHQQEPGHKDPGGSHMLDLLDVNLGPIDSGPIPTTSAPVPLQDPWGMPIPPSRPQTLDLRLNNWNSVDPWSVSSSTATNPSVADPWSPAPAASAPPKPMIEDLLGLNLYSTNIFSNHITNTDEAASVDPWKAVKPQNDPWSPATEPSPALSSPLNDLDEFDIITNRNNINNNNKTCISPNPFDMRGLGESLNDRNGLGSAKRKSPHAFLGENSGLVNLDNLVTKPTQSQQSQQQPLRPVAANPFSPVGAPLQPVRNTPAFAPQAISQPLVPQPNPFLS
ncbi:unnamed protein product [Nezara viridula]|uniref:ENTH domain-containing protein n=1 Tax=Nezara viridula TaxID=85310 RepID=A0A9P0HE10_NEZVI|nr:unnamed protein product [Nezara viridula]